MCGVGLRTRAGKCSVIAPSFPQQPPERVLIRVVGILSELYESDQPDVVIVLIDVLHDGPDSDLAGFEEGVVLDTLQHLLLDAVPQLLGRPHAVHSLPGSQIFSYIIE